MIQMAACRRKKYENNIFISRVFSIFMLTIFDGGVSVTFRESAKEQQVSKVI